MVFLDLPLPLVIGTPSTWSTLLTIESTGLLYTCPNHLWQYSTIFSTIGATPSSTLMLSFQILSRLVFPLTSTTLPSLLQWVYSHVDLLPPNNLSHATRPILWLYDKTFPPYWMVSFFHIKHLKLSSISTTPTWIQPTSKEI